MKDFFNENRNKCIIGLFVTMFLIVMLVTGCLDDIVVGIIAVIIAIMGFIVAIIVPILITLIGLALYCLPTIISIVRKHSNKTPIILVNVLLGWCVVGWIISLIWAFTDNTKY